MRPICFSILSLCPLLNNLSLCVLYSWTEKNNIPYLVWCTHLEQWPVAAGKATGRSPRVGQSDRRSVSTWFPTTNWVSGSSRESHGDKESRKTSVKSFGGVSRGLHGDKSFGSHHGIFVELLDLRRGELREGHEGNQAYRYYWLVSG